MNRAAPMKIVLICTRCMLPGMDFVYIFKKFGEGERLFYLRSPVYGPLAQLV